MENKHKKFQPYDRVLVREHYIADGAWIVDLYSHYSDGFHYCIGIIDISDSDILPYEGNEHLVGTTDEPEEEIKLKKGEYVMAKTENKNWVLAKYQEHNELPWTNINVKFSNGNVVSVDEVIRFSDFNLSDMEETRKHILCVKNGIIVKSEKE